MSNTTEQKETMKLIINEISQVEDSKYKVNFEVVYGDKSKVLEKEYNYKNKNFVELLAVKDMIVSISNKGQNRNIIIESDNTYFDSLFKYKRLFTFKNNDWKTKNGDEIKFKDLLSEIHTLLTTNNHDITHELKQ
jgi:ribonuclease HI